MPPKDTFGNKPVKLAKNELVGTMYFCAVYEHSGNKEII